MQRLVGETINYIYRNDDDFIVFLTNADRFWGYLWCGECCLNTWIEDIINPENMIGSPIISVVEKEYVDTDGDDTSFGYLITTAKGYTDIELRSDQSSFYSGTFDYIANMDICIEDQRPLSRKITERMTCYDIQMHCPRVNESHLKTGHPIYIIRLLMMSYYKHGDCALSKLYKVSI